MSTTKIEWIEDIERLHRGYWFAPDTMRFFGTRFLDSGRVYGGRYFVTSETPPSGPRIYSVRDYDRETDTIRTVSRHDSGREAITSAKALVRR